MKLLTFFRNASPTTLILISFGLGFVSIFFEKSLPNLFLVFRLAIFVLFVFAVIKYFKSN